MSTDTTTTTPSQTEAAQALIEKVRALQQEVPNFTFPKPGSSTQSLSRCASVPPQFVYSTAAAVQNNPVLVRGGAADPDQLRNLMAFGEAYTPLADEIEAFGRFLRHTIAAAKNEAGAEALTTYSLTQRLSKRAGTAYLAPVAEALRHVLGPKSKKSGAQPAPTTPTTPTTPTA